MKAVVMTAVGSPDVLQVRDIASLELPDESHCLVRVRAAGVNPLDCRVRRMNAYHPDQLPAVLGCDGAGSVERAGRACTRFKAGDEVYFFNAGLGGAHSGCYAQYTVVHEDYLARKPANVGMVEAAALPLALRVVVGDVLPLEQAAQAHALIEEGHAQGKIVLEIA